METDPHTSASPRSEPESSAAETPDSQPASCPGCAMAPLPTQGSFCPECGYLATDPPTTPSPLEAVPSSESEVAAPSSHLLAGRYKLGTLISNRAGVLRFHGLDHGDGRESPTPVHMVRAALPAEPNPEPTWPGLAWEKHLLETSRHISLPELIDQFEADGYAYLIEHVPAGIPLWDFWQDPQRPLREKYDALIQIARLLSTLHEHQAMLAGICPSVIHITPWGAPVLQDLSDLLPLPVPAGTRVRDTLYMAPELRLHPEHAGPTANLYSFGALLCALTLGRELQESDFVYPMMPRSIMELLPDHHPALLRLLGKTFRHELEFRFPTEEVAVQDPTGLRELISTLAVCRDLLSRTRVDIAAWSSTGMIRTANEDAVIVLHHSVSRYDVEQDQALAVLSDGMGGMESGEVAAEITTRTLLDLLAVPFLTGQLPHAPAEDAETSALEDEQPASAAEVEPAAESVDSEAGQTSDSGKANPEPPDPIEDTVHDASIRPVLNWRELLLEALKEANREVFEYAQQFGGKHRMGCTAEVVFIDGSHALVGHVGDSRTYHYHAGQLQLMTHDQSLVNRLVELGQLTVEEAKFHPRRSELFQAIGCQVIVEPEITQFRLRPGDWVIICSDGLSNQLEEAVIMSILDQAHSAEQAARRLINLVNAQGAVDNATVVVVRLVG